MSQGDVQHLLVSRPKCPTCNLRLRDGKCIKLSCNRMQMNAVPEEDLDEPPTILERDINKVRARSRSTPSDSRDRGPSRPKPRSKSPRDLAAARERRSPRGTTSPRSSPRGSLSIDVSAARSPRSGSSRISPRSPRGSIDTSVARRSPRSPRGSPRGSEHVSKSAPRSPRGSPRGSLTEGTRGRRSSSVSKVPCVRCSQEIRSRAAECVHCGAQQRPAAEASRIPGAGARSRQAATSARPTRRLERSQTMGSVSQRKNCVHCGAVMRSRAVECPGCCERQQEEDRSSTPSASKTRAQKISVALAEVALEDSRDLDSMVAFMQERKEVRTSGGKPRPRRAKSGGDLGRGRGTGRGRGEPGARRKPLPQSTRKARQRPESPREAAHSAPVATSAATAEEAEEEDEDIFAFDLGESMDMNIGVSSAAKDGIQW